jgi:hypothetical protein
MGGAVTVEQVRSVEAFATVRTSVGSLIVVCLIISQRCEVSMLVEFTELGLDSSTVESLCHTEGEYKSTLSG